MEKISREKFIRLGTALGVGAAGASLAACGEGASSSGGGGSGGGESGGGDSGGSQASSPSSSGEAKGGGQAKGDGEAKGGGQAKGDGGAKGGGGAKAGGAAIASESEVAPGSAVTFKDAGNPAVLIHLDSGDFVAYSAVCTHQGCTVPYKNGQLVCPCHGSIFDPADGAAVVAGPAQTPLPEIPVKVVGGEIVRA